MNEKKLNARIMYNGKWYNASVISISKDGFAEVVFCHDLEGRVRQENVEKMEIIPEIDSEAEDG